jgi:FSR family fosmidomycin resistance protein-like MFS transporter
MGIIISSAFPAILVYAQELLPKNSEWFLVFYGFAFGMGGLGSALLEILRIIPVLLMSIIFVPFTFDWDHCFLLPNLKRNRTAYSNLSLSKSFFLILPLFFW